MVALTLSSRRLLDACALSLLLLANSSTATASASVSIVDNGKVATVDGIKYYVGGIAVSKLIGITSKDLERAAEADVDVIPLTVIRTDEAEFTAQTLDATVSNYTASDDVFQEGFLRAIYLSCNGNGQATIDSTFTANALRKQKPENKLFMTSPQYQSAAAAESDDGPVKADLENDLPKGPYFVSARTGDIFKAFRLYSDHQLAFIEAAISDEKDGFFPLPAVTEGAMTKSVAVPSRLYYTPTEEKPLVGLRLGVKDIFDLKGLRTSGGNRAYHDLYPPRNATGPALQRLIDLGAVIVGKMGTVQFANGDNPTADWVDFHCPFNPRGDGYQSPGGSSSGPGAGIASYPWLDIAVGSDTGGSMRQPSGLQGLFGNRPSTGAVSLEHVLPLAHALDTAGVFARSAATWSRVVRAWYKDFNSSYTKYPRNIFYSRGDFPSPEEDETGAGGLLEDVVVKIENFLGVKRTPVDVVERWEETHKNGTVGDLKEMLNTTYALLTSVDQYRSLALPFFADYSTAHNGRRPFINPGPLARWAWGQQNGGDEGFNQALKNKTIFKDWWESSSGFGRRDNETCSEGIFLYPYSMGKRQYRNEYFDGPTAPPLGWKTSRIAPFAGVPDLVVPVGEIPYNSTVTGRTEYMPVTMSIVAAWGCDLMVARLVEELEEKGVLREVRTGTRMYPDPADFDS